MSNEMITDLPSQSTGMLDWTPPVPPTNLIFDDGEPLETPRHRIAMNTLIRSLQHAWADRSDVYVGGNMFVYYSSTQVKNQDFRGPDFFAVCNVDGNRPRQGWVIWEEGGRYPDVIIELLSTSTAETDRGVKKQLYERVFRTPDYFIFDPFDANSLEGWHLDTSKGYQPIAKDHRGWLWCETLGLWLGTWEGVIDREPPTGTCHWARFYDKSGKIVPLPEESAEHRGVLRSLLRLLQSRFGSIPMDVEPCLKAMEVEQLEELVVVSGTVSSFEEFKNRIS